MSLAPTEARLSRREAEILNLASSGHTDKEICRVLDLTMPTVRTYWNRMRQKLKATNRAQCVAIVVTAQTNEPPEAVSLVLNELRRHSLGFWTWDTSTHKVSLDQTARVIFGIVDGSEPLSLQKFLTSVAPDDRRRLEHFLRQTSRSCPSLEHRVNAQAEFSRCVRSVKVADACGSAEHARLLIATTLVTPDPAPQL